MSIVRVSVLKRAVYGVTDEGNLVDEPYNKRRHLGRTEELYEKLYEQAGGKGDFSKANSDLRHYLKKKIAAASDQLDGPVVVMVNGFLFDPKQVVSSDPKKTDNPHGRVYHYVNGVPVDEQRHHTTGWPLQLGFFSSDEVGASGMAFAFGWQSQPGFASSIIKHFQNFYARAYEKGTEAAWNLITCLEVLCDELPDEKPIDLFCHSLGSHVVVRAIALLVKHKRDDILRRLDMVMILGGAEYVVEAQIMYSRVQDAGYGDTISFYNFVSRENDVLDVLGENFGPRTFGNTNVIGHNGLDLEDPANLGNWLDIQIDSHLVQDWMAKRDHDVAGDRPGNIWDHWYYYTYRGNMMLYRDMLRNRENWRIADLRAAGIPDKVSKRWSKFGQ